jgi:hypothetical protein
MATKAKHGEQPTPPGEKQPSPPGAPTVHTPGYTDRVQQILNNARNKEQTA